MIPTSGLTVLNVGLPVTVHLAVDGVPTAPVLNTGDTLALTGPPDQVATWLADMACAYPDVVRVDSDRARAYRDDERRRQDLAEATSFPDHVLEAIRELTVNGEPLKAIMARVEAATPGPWEWGDGAVSAPNGDILMVVVDGTMPDTSFAAHARTDVPVLVAAVERLRVAAAVVLEYLEDRP